MAKPKYELPTSQQDLKERQQKDWEPSTVVPGDTSESPLDAHGFVGVDPIYQNAANSVDRPMQATEGPEAKIFEANGQQDNVWDGGDDDDDSMPEVEDPNPGTPAATPPTPATPTQSTPTSQTNR